MVNSSLNCGFGNEACVETLIRYNAVTEHAIRLADLRKHFDGIKTLLN